MIYPGVKEEMRGDRENLAKYRTELGDIEMVNSVGKEKRKGDREKVKPGGIIEENWGMEGVNSVGKEKRKGDREKVKPGGIIDEN